MNQSPEARRYAKHIMTSDNAPEPNALPASLLLVQRRSIRALTTLLAAGALLQLSACSTTPAPTPRANWEPGCTGPASFCVPFFGP
jgi:hypothetical protein